MPSVGVAYASRAMAPLRNAADAAAVVRDRRSARLSEVYARAKLRS